tara:strand:+ start:130 stop:738 length:609 start_codon:yes stop_codon:yes gene_type:complete
MTGEQILVRRGVVFSSAMLCLLVLTSTAALDPQGLWTYFTNWNFIIQYISYVSVLENRHKRQWVVDLGTLSVWTVAVSYTVVLLVSRTALDRLYELYSFYPFWLGNFFIHYLPAILNTIGIRSPLRSLRERAIVFAVLAVLLVIYNVTHDTRKVYFSDVIGPYEGMGYMILAAFLLQVRPCTFGRSAATLTITPAKVDRFGL